MEKIPPVGKNDPLSSKKAADSGDKFQRAIKAVEKTDADNRQRKKKQDEVDEAALLISPDLLATPPPPIMLAAQAPPPQQNEGEQRVELTARAPLGAAPEASQENREQPNSGISPVAASQSPTIPPQEPQQGSSQTPESEPASQQSQPSTTSKRAAAKKAAPLAPSAKKIVKEEVAKVMKEVKEKTAKTAPKKIALQEDLSQSGIATPTPLAQEIKVALASPQEKGLSADAKKLLTDMVSAMTIRESVGGKEVAVTLKGASYDPKSPFYGVTILVEEGKVQGQYTITLLNVKDAGMQLLTGEKGLPSAQTAGLLVRGMGLTPQQQMLNTLNTGAQGYKIENIIVSHLSVDEYRRNQSGGDQGQKGKREQNPKEEEEEGSNK